MKIPTRDGFLGFVLWLCSEKFKLGDCCSMDYEDGAFDVVTTMNTIYFWEDTRKTMSEVYRVLKSGGVFYNAVIKKENLDSVFYTKSGFKKFKDEEYIEIGRDEAMEIVTGILIDETMESEEKAG